VLKDVSFKIEAGQVAAIVGPSGTGKTTVVSLIPRFYDPESGYVGIDGTDIRKYRLKSLRDQISFVLQDTLLFRATIWENIAYGKPNAMPAEIRRAAELAEAHGFIEEMPEGYDTMVGANEELLALNRRICRNAQNPESRGSRDRRGHDQLELNKFARDDVTAE
jgi:subfamily B ATP-binding cassette protein MsbA